MSQREAHVRLHEPTLDFGYRWLLVDQEAVDVSRLTGIPWYWGRLHQRGPQHPLMDLNELEWWDQWLVLWARVGAHAFIDFS